MKKKTDKLRELLQLYYDEYKTLSMLAILNPEQKILFESAVLELGHNMKKSGKTKMSIYKEIAEATGKHWRSIQNICKNNI